MTTRDHNYNVVVDTILSLLVRNAVGFIFVTGISCILATGVANAAYCDFFIFVFGIALTFHVP